ncbi:uncharacterized protein TNCV_3264501 [Trichonephila clavipes]|nr:uncharacterized protein TNCV_3264501 [Trichonephila clavipes]
MFSKILGEPPRQWYRYRIVVCLVTSSIPVPLKTRRVGQRCTATETSSRWCGVVVRRGGASSGVVHVKRTPNQNKMAPSAKPKQDGEPDNGGKGI